MITISTDMYHHCGPRVGVLRGDQHRHRLRIGVRQEQREQVFVPGQDQHEHEGRGESRAHERQRDGEEDAELRGAVDFGALLEVEGNSGEKVTRQPDDDREVDAGVGRDQRDLRIEQLQILEHDVDRQHGDDRRHDPVRDHPELDVVVAERGA